MHANLLVFVGSLFALVFTYFTTVVMQFDCRTLSNEVSILSVDNTITCQDGTWVLFAGFAALGLAAVSFGVPLILLFIMHKTMKAKLEEVRTGQKRAVVAFNEFGREYDYVVRDDNIPLLVRRQSAVAFSLAL